MKKDQKKGCVCTWCGYTLFMNAVAKTASDTTTRHVGNCQICEGDQKLHDGKMVHHGYQRPGHGSILGDCPGVGHVPYEVSCDLVKSHRGLVGTRLVHLESRLADLKSGNVKRLTKVERAWGTLGRSETVEYLVGVTEPYQWKRAVESATWEVESSIRQCEREIGRCTRRIDAWTSKPVRTVEEEQAKADTDKAARKAERDAAKAARDAKKAASRAKTEALEAKRTAVREGFENQFRVLAAGSGAERQWAARSLLAELDKTKYRSWLSRYDLQCEEAFVALGLAVQDGVNGRGRPYLRWL